MNPITAHHKNDYFIKVPKKNKTRKGSEGCMSKDPRYFEHCRPEDIKAEHVFDSYLRKSKAEKQEI